MFDVGRSALMYKAPDNEFLGEAGRGRRTQSTLPTPICLSPFGAGCKPNCSATLISVIWGERLKLIDYRPVSAVSPTCRVVYDVHRAQSSKPPTADPRRVARTDQLMPMKCTCSHCGATLRIVESQALAGLRCPRCGGDIPS